MVGDLNKVYLSYQDVKVIPTSVTYVEHRDDINPYKNGMLPIFASPMSSVVDEFSWRRFQDNKIIPIIPRTLSFPLEIRLELAEKEDIWITMSLDEFINWTEETIKSNKYAYIICKLKILIDMANGHMVKLIKACQKAKMNIKGLTIMAGNIANPRAVYEYVNAGIDYIRIGIGSGMGCITTSNCGIHYPMASLIADCKKALSQCSKPVFFDREIRPMLVADGGIRNYDDVIKALALGADYVMIGGLLASCLGSGGEYWFKLENSGNEDSVSQKLELTDVDSILQDGVILKEIGCPDLWPVNYSIGIGENLYKKFYGMASKSGQIDMKGAKVKMAEGKEEFIKVDKRLDKWSENMADCLRTALSYCNCRSLIGFYNNAVVIRVSQATVSSINK
jgi:hypothetical protein